jgi:hypothetical protein
MVQRRKRDRSLFEVLLPDGHKLWPDWLRKIDTLLEDEAVMGGYGCSDTWAPLRPTMCVRRAPRRRSQTDVPRQEFFVNLWDNVPSTS